MRTSEAWKWVLVGAGTVGAGSQKGAVSRCGAVGAGAVDVEVLEL